MSHPLTEQEVLQQLAPCFHAHYRKLQQTHIQNSEDIYAVTACSINDFRESEYQCSTSNHLGYMVLTTHRRLLIGLSHTPPTVKWIVYYKRHIEAGLTAKFFGVRSDWRRWALPPYPNTFPEDARFFVVEKQLRTVEKVIKSDFELSHEGKRVNLREFSFSDDRKHAWFVAFEAIDGKKIYDLMLSAIHNGGRLAFLPETPPQIATSDVTELLQKLSDLHKAGVLTDDEFNAKKQELLRRI